MRKELNSQTKGLNDLDIQHTIGFISGNHKWVDLDDISYALRGNDEYITLALHQIYEESLNEKRRTGYKEDLLKDKIPVFSYKRDTSLKKQGASERRK